MDGQMSIWDFIKPKELSLDDIPEAEMVRQISAATGLDFKYIDDFWGWQVKVKKVTFAVKYDNYRMEDNTDRFIGADWQTTTQGSSVPCDSIPRAIKFFQAAIERMNKSEEGAEEEMEE